MRLLRAAVVVAAIPALATLSAVVERFDARADCLPYAGIGADPTYAIRSDGSLWEYGTASAVGTAVPETPVLDRASMVDATNHALAIRDGVVWTWGEDTFGQNGDGSPGPGFRPFPLPLTSLPPIVDVASGSYHSLARSAAGEVWAWGFNIAGQVGDGTTSSRHVPVKVPNLSGVVDVAAGYYHSLVAKSDGTVWGWGYNSFGQLGIGTTTGYRTSPVQATKLTGIVAVEAMYGSLLALKNDGTVWISGLSAGGGTPVQLSGISGASAISASAWGYHWMALKPDGSVWTWGENTYGQIGDGTTQNRYTPYRVPGLPRIVAIAAGSGHSLALDDTGRVWGWGYNGGGRLGDGTSTRRYTPVRASNLTQCLSPDLSTLPSPSPSVSPVPVPTVSGPPVGEEAPVAECRFARYQGEIVYGGYAVVGNGTPPSTTRIRCTVQSGEVYDEAASSAPGAVAAVTGTAAASPAPITVCTYADAVYAGGRTVSTSYCRDA
jgi:alpha-tubulin suppressor-like RCC1 family protein